MDGKSGRIWGGWFFNGEKNVSAGGSYVCSNNLVWKAGRGTDRPSGGDLEKKTGIIAVLLCVGQGSFLRRMGLIYVCNALD